MMNMFDRFKLYQTKAFERKADMIWTLILSGFLINIVGILAMPQTAQAHRTPLSTDELEESACCIVVGKVKSLSSREVKVQLGSEHQFTAIVEVKSVKRWIPESGSKRPDGSFAPPSDAPKPGKNIEVKYRRRGGATGVTSQDSNLPLDAQVRLFLTTYPDGHLHLLEPNGWEAISSD
ncbi:hypothetical protein Cylst_2589 [Cylindrospermum stagnale PCC 7417]|uniref:Uncharacterized protein n=2 Tax=Cylindrospermum stagnale TaxID=142864 RepID=K9WWN6_9NOST|nr:hypothetical protein Cylst_2589 [Cylindrospermum stagnale PCC 7417]